MVAVIKQGIIASAKHSFKQVIKDQMLLWWHIISRKVSDIGHERRIWMTETQKLTQMWLTVPLRNLLHTHNKKRSLYDFIWLFSSITHVYQIFTYTGLYTRNFKIRIFMTFTNHLYTRTVMYQPHTKFFYTFQFYTRLFLPLFCFLSRSDIFLLIPHKIWSLIQNQCVWKYANLSCKRHLDLIYIYFH